MRVRVGDIEKFFKIFFAGLQYMYCTTELTFYRDSQAGITGYTDKNEN
jgi:hypothetical protein